MTGPRYVIRADGGSLRTWWRCRCDGLVPADPALDRTPGAARGCPHCGAAWVLLADAFRSRRAWALLDEADALDLFGLEGPRA